MSDLFVYGTLRFPLVLETLLGRVPDLSPARAEGWRVAALPRRVYPGLVAAPGIADGLVISGLSPEELQILHDYEDDEYDVEEITLVDGRRALAYIWTTEASSEDWDVEAFASDYLGDFMAGEFTAAEPPTP